MVCLGTSKVCPVPNPYTAQKTILKTTALKTTALKTTTLKTIYSTAGEGKRLVRARFYVCHPRTQLNTAKTAIFPTRLPTHTATLVIVCACTPLALSD